MITHHIDPVRRIITTRVAGPLTVAGLSDYLPRLFRDPKFDASYNSLVVAMSADAVPSPAIAALLAPLVKTWSARRSGCRWAFVLPDRASREAAEMRLAQVRVTAVVTRCFVSEVAAIAWLESGTTAHPASTIAV
jgi:hypothetical protein